MEEIILKQLNKEKLSAEEKVKLEKWLTVDQKNARIFNQLKLNLKGATPMELEEMKGEVWENLATRIKQPISAKRHHNISLTNWLKIAAIFILFVGMGSFIYFESMIINTESVTDRIFIEKESQDGQKLTFTLSDGSIVKLNAGSKITFPKDFDADSREIKLTGEAFFDIVRDENRPFRIVTENLNVVVLGTSFNVRVYPDDKEMLVAVKTGKVSVDLQNNGDRFILDPNELVSYSTSTMLAEKHAFEDSQLIFGWADKQLVYRNANITQIMKDLSRWYGVDFEINKVLDYDKKISGRYDNPSLADVMESLSFAYDFSFSINGKKIMIK